MNNKQERIGIKIEIYDPCGECMIKEKCAKNIDPQAFLKDTRSCFQYKLLNRLPTREDMLNKISMVLFELNSPTSWIYENAPATLKEHYKNQAEKILNKILEK